MGEVIFRISGDKFERLIRWQRQVDARVYREQNRLSENEITPDMMLPLDENGVLSLRFGASYLTPHYGDISDVYRFMVVPTTLGPIIKVLNLRTGDELDLTDSEDW
jgi:hypothetical protein